MRNGEPAMIRDHLTAAIQEVFLLTEQRQSQDLGDAIEHICAAHGLSGEERALMENVAREMAGDRPAAAPTMHNASLYRAPSDLLLT
jgi:hypothetical protein